MELRSGLLQMGHKCVHVSMCFNVLVCQKMKIKREEKRRRTNALPCWTTEAVNVTPLKEAVWFLWVDHVWPYACFVSHHGYAVSVGIFLSRPVVCYHPERKSLSVLTDLGSDHTPLKPRLLKGCLICDQVEAAFLRRVLLLDRHVCFLFSHVTERPINNSNVCMCVCIVKCQEKWGKYLSWWLQWLSKSVKWWNYEGHGAPLNNSGKHLQ